MHLFHTLDFSLLHLSFVLWLVIIVLLLGLDSELTLGDLEDRHFLCTDFASTGTFLKVLLTLLLLQCLFHLILSGKFSCSVQDTLILKIIRNISDPVHEVFLCDFTKLILIESLLELSLHPSIPLLELNLPHSDYLVESSLLGACSVSDWIVEDQGVGLDGLDGLLLDFHGVPSGLLDAVTEELQT